MEVIICDGCFDPKKENRSTDGTREIISEFIEETKNAKMISAKRPTTTGSIKSSLFNHPSNNIKNLLNVPRANSLYSMLRTVAYRRNQAITFNHMISISDKWEPGRWFMTYDADQFYTDELIDSFAITNSETDFGLLTGTELTFLKSFDEYTLDYEQREYNNMPHKIYPDTFIWPTRDVGLVGRSRSKTSLSDQWGNHRYIHHVDTEDVGEYCHYKLPDLDPQRFEQGYQLGDREPPDNEKYSMKSFDRDHPKIIDSHFNV
ncbi:hypothetical protein [Halorubrum sp. DTA46]|uniref:hypothetical protein n=1 Tax=Halorubrum sp. DTA46 TaxID=3402162 RepID=UPI003AAA3739